MHIYNNNLPIFLLEMFHIIFNRNQNTYILSKKFFSENSVVCEIHGKVC